MLSVDTNSLRHLLRRSNKNCELQFHNSDRFKKNYSIDGCVFTVPVVINMEEGSIQVLYNAYIKT